LISFRTNGVLKIEPIRLQLLPLVKDLSFKYGLPTSLVNAIIEVESSYCLYAVRFEFKAGYTTPEKFALLNGITTETELNLQKFSYGLMQLLGSSARDLGFEGPLPSLHQPEIGIEWGCKKLAQLEKRYPIGSDSIAAYNTGSPLYGPDGHYVNRAYVDKVESLFSQVSDS
jgi:soluble lytic murein transglycosylase-like protein